MTSEATPEPTKELVIDHGEITFGRYIIGELDNPNELRVNLGWARRAGLSVVLEDDPAVDNHRGGIAFERRYSD